MGVAKSQTECERAVMAPRKSQSFRMTQPSGQWSLLGCSRTIWSSCTTFGGSRSLLPAFCAAANKYSIRAHTRSLVLSRAHTDCAHFFIAPGGGREAEASGGGAKGAPRELHPCQVQGFLRGRRCEHPPHMPYPSARICTLSAQSLEVSIQSSARVLGRGVQMVGRN